MSRRLKKYGYDVFSTDIVMRDDYADKLIDFMNDELPSFNGDIITNPPYTYVCDFVLKALNTVEEGHKVAMFLKIQALEGQERYERIYKNYPPKTIYVFIKRIQCAKNNIFQGSSAVCYAWFVWEKGFKGTTSLKWI